MLFIRHKLPEYQIQLNENAELFLADGGVLLGARLTPDLIPLLAWDPHFQSKGAAIGPASARVQRHHAPSLFDLPQSGVQQLRYGE